MYQCNYDEFKTLHLHLSAHKQRLRIICVIYTSDIIRLNPNHPKGQIAFLSQ